MNDTLRDFLSSGEWPEGKEPPTLTAMHRALEQPAEADQDTLDYIGLRPDLVRLILDLATESDHDQIDEV